MCFFANANIQLNSGLITARVNIWQYSNYFWSFRFFLLWCMYLKNSLFGFIVRTFSPSAVLSISSSSIFVWLILTSPSHQSVFIVICSVKLKNKKSGALLSRLIMRELVWKWELAELTGHLLCVRDQTGFLFRTPTLIHPPGALFFCDLWLRVKVIVTTSFLMRLCFASSYLVTLFWKVN